MTDTGPTIADPNRLDGIGYHATGMRGSIGPTNNTGNLNKVRTGLRQTFADRLTPEQHAALLALIDNDES